MHWPFKEFRVSEISSGRIGLVSDQRDGTGNQINRQRIRLLATVCQGQAPGVRPQNRVDVWLEQCIQCQVNTVMDIHLHRSRTLLPPGTFGEGKQSAQARHPLSYIAHGRIRWIRGTNCDIGGYRIRKVPGCWYKPQVFNTSLHVPPGYSCRDLYNVKRVRVI